MSTFFSDNDQKNLSVLQVLPHHDRERLDKVLVSLLPTYSRSFFKNLIDNRSILIDGIVASTAGIQVRAGQQITVLPDYHAVPVETIPIIPSITIIYEAQDFVVISKPAGLLVHLTPHSTTEPTVVDWLRNRYGEPITSVGQPERPGIVHRLDKDTSGLMVLARTHKAHRIFSQLFETRAIKKEYHAVVTGVPVPASGTITYPIGRDPYSRTKMVAITPTYTARTRVGELRTAITDYQVCTVGRTGSLIRVALHTGRTHQVRVHMQAIGHPLVGDTVYGKPSAEITRHALHATGLQFSFDGVPYSFTDELPADIAALCRP